MHDGSNLRADELTCTSQAMYIVQQVGEFPKAHENEGPWSGEKAALMYEKLGVALRKHFGNLRTLHVVEDGDAKGFQSAKGKRQKRKEKITSWQLPPHSRGRMPLDFCLWDEIDHRTLDKWTHENESIASYKKRLDLTTKCSPKTLIKNCLAKMKGDIQATVDSWGAHTKQLLD